MMNKVLSSIDAYILLNKCFQNIEGSRIKKIYNVDDDRLLFKIRGRDNDFLLMFDMKRGLYPVTFSKLEKLTISPFVKKLRKYLNNSVIEAFSQVNGDRIYLMVVRRGSEFYHVYLEWIREGNVILTDSEGNIIVAYRMREYRDRKILQGEKYSPPPAKGIDPLLIDYIEIEKSKVNQRIINFLLKNINISPIFIDHALKKSGIDPSDKIKNICWKRIKECLHIIISMVEEAILNQKYYFVRENDKVIDILPFYPLIRSDEINPVDNICDFLDKHFYYISPRDEEKKDMGKEKIIEKSIQSFEYKINVLRSFAQHLEKNYYRYQLLLEKYKQMRENKENYEKIRKTLIGMNPSVENIDFLKNVIYVKFNNERFMLNASKSLYENISEIYNIAKQYQRKIERARRLLTSNKSLRKEKLIIKRYPKRKWFENFRWFISSSGIEVIGGRDAPQNETLVKKYLKEDDLFFHADIHGGSVVIVQTKKGSIDDKTISEASSFAAIYSKAWEIGLYSIDVYWVYGRQVSKKPPSGEYLPKGAFMIYGKKNYIRNVPLELVIGFKLIEENSDIFYRIYYGPKEPIQKRSDVIFVLRPGRVKREFMIKKIKKNIEKYVSDILNKEVVINNLHESIASCLPKGGFYLIGYYRM